MKFRKDNQIYYKQSVVLKKSLPSGVDFTVVKYTSKIVARSGFNFYKLISPNLDDIYIQVDLLNLKQRKRFDKNAIIFLGEENVLDMS